MNSIIEAISRTWPGMPFLAYGIWQAWSVVAYSGYAWLSEVDDIGFYLSLMFVVSTCAFALTCLVSALITHWRHHIGRTQNGPLPFSSSGVAMVGGVLASLGSFGIIAVGPCYLGAVFPALSVLFYPSAVVTGIGTALVMLRIAWCCSFLSMRKLLVYAGFSQMLIALIYFSVIAAPDCTPIAGGPTLCGELAFILLPILAALMACCPSRYIHVKQADRTKMLFTLRIDGELLKFLLLLFVLSFVSSLLRSTITSPGLISDTVQLENNISLFRLLLSPLLLAAAALLPSKLGTAIGKNCSVFLACIVMLCALLALVTEAQAVVSFLINCIYACFAVLTWCLFSLISRQKMTSHAILFGMGFFVLMFSCTLGWWCGLYIMPELERETASYVYFACAFAVFICGFLVSSESSFVRLFTPINESALDVADIPPSAEQKDTKQLDGDNKHNGRWFQDFIDKQAAEHMLSPREKDVFRCLAMGYGTKTISDKLGLAQSTIRTHIHNVYTKLDVHSRDELMALVDVSKSVYKHSR